MRQLYKGFKKIAEDNDSARLVHDNGHELTISKKGLSKQLRSGLEELPLFQAEGTPTEDDAPQFIPENQALQEKEPAEQPATQKETGGHKVGRLIKEHLINPALEDLQKGYLDPLKSYNYRLGKAILEDVYDPVAEASKGLLGIDEAQPEPAKKPTEGIEKTAYSPQEQSRNLAQQPAKPTPSPSDVYGMATQPATDQASGIPNIPEEMKNIPGFMQAYQAYPELAKAQQAEYEKQALIQKNAADASRIAMQYFESSHRELQNDISDTLTNMRDGKMNPNHYLESLGAGQKIALAIGGILAGAGAGVLHQENPVYKFLNNQIERDLMAQKSNMENQNNLLTQLQNKYHNDIVADNMFRVIRAEQTAHELEAAASNSKLAQAMPNAKIAQSLLMQHYMPFYQAARAMNASRQLEQQGARPQGVAGNLPPEAQGELAAKQALLKKMGGLISDEQLKEINKEIELQVKSVKAQQAGSDIINRIFQRQTLGARTAAPFQAPQQVAQAKAELYPLIQELDVSKRLTKEQIESELEPFVPKITTNEATKDQMINGFQELVRLHTPYPSNMHGSNITIPKYAAPEQYFYYKGHKYRKVPGGGELVKGG